MNCVQTVKQKKATLLTIYEVPHYMRTNSFITTGYRPEMDWKRAVTSVLHLHNGCIFFTQLVYLQIIETVNIWTHLLGAIGFSLFWTYLMLHELVHESWDNKIAFTFCVSCVSILLL